MNHAIYHGFLTEADVIEGWPMIPGAALRRARRRGEIRFYQFPGGPCYRLQDLEAFIEQKYSRGLVLGDVPRVGPTSLAKTEPIPSGLQGGSSHGVPLNGEQGPRTEEIARLEDEVSRREIVIPRARRAPEADRLLQKPKRKPGRPRKGV